MTSSCKSIVTAFPTMAGGKPGPRFHAVRSTVAVALKPSCVRPFISLTVPVNVVASVTGFVMPWNVRSPVTFVVPFGPAAMLVLLKVMMG